MTPQLTPIYCESDYLIMDCVDLLRDNPNVAPYDNFDWIKHRALLEDLRALARNHNPRVSAATALPRVIFIDESGCGNGRFGQLMMELVPATEGNGGELYPSLRMTGVLTDAAWDGALTAAFYHARNCGFAIPKNQDVRWAVQFFELGSHWDSESRPLPQALKPGDHLTGRSAGVSFFLGLFALSQFHTSPGPWHAGRIAGTIVSLAVLPDPETRCGRLLPLGSHEDQKRSVLASKSLSNQLLVIVPSTGRFAPVLGTLREMVIPTVDALAEHLHAAVLTFTLPDNLPPSNLSRFVGKCSVVNNLQAAVRQGSLHVVVGQGGVGKTATVLQATGPLWEEGQYHARIWINLYHFRPNHVLDDYVLGTIVRVMGEVPLPTPNQLRDQVTQHLSSKRCLILIEGGEHVPAKKLKSLISGLGGQTVVVMTRRFADADQLNGLRHEILPMSADEALELLLVYAGASDIPEKVSSKQCWEAIAEAAARLPLFLTWAGLALYRASLEDVMGYLEELRANPLIVLSADPDDRLNENAGRFLEQSLARVLPTSEHHDLPEIAKRHFMWLYAFDRESGVPCSLWQEAVTSSGIPVSKRASATARRALINLGLVQQCNFGPEEQPWILFRPVHALAWEACKRMWTSQIEANRTHGLTKLVIESSTLMHSILEYKRYASLEQCNRFMAAAMHYKHWVSIAGAKVFADQDVAINFEIGDTQTEPWTRHRSLWTRLIFKVLTECGNHPLVGIGWEAVLSDLEGLYKAHPDSYNHASYLAKTATELAIHLSGQRSFATARVHFTRAIDISNILVTRWGHDQPILLASHCDLLIHTGDHLDEVGETVEAEKAYLAALTGIELAMKLVEPNVPVSWGSLHASCLGKLSLSKAIQEKLGGEEGVYLAELEELESIWNQTLDRSDGQLVAYCLRSLGTWRRQKGDLVGARNALERSVTLSRELGALNQHDAGLEIDDTLASCLGHLADLEMDEGNSQTAVDLLGDGLQIRTRLAERRSLDFPSLLRLRQEWVSIADAYRLAGRIHEAAQAGEQACAICRKLIAMQPEDVGLIRRLIESLGDSAKAFTQLGDFDAAMRNQSEACALAEGLLSRHQDEAESMLVWCEAHQSMAFIEIQAEHFESARDLLIHSVQNLDQLCAKIINEETRALLAGGLYFLAFVQGRLGDFEDAETLVRRSICLDEACLASRESGYSHHILRNLRTSKSFLGGVQEKAGEESAAIATWSDGVSIGEQLLELEPNAADLPELVARDCVRLGSLLFKLGEAEAGMAKIMRGLAVYPSVATTTTWSGEDDYEGLAEAIYEADSSQGTMLIIGGISPSGNIRNVSGET